MGVGWAINSAIIFIAATAFFSSGIIVDDLAQAGNLLAPILGPLSADIFGVALLFAGIAASLTSSMAGAVSSPAWSASLTTRRTGTRRSARSSP